ncbi:hypothetical protein QAD02_001407 [Eretmocerus hayati]|uniref:Uncharacterized protein n=1 Tax=Eretmocerus hayati TaxID=131215 RepID=A0ACC2NG51_9HYME|nr:hypothetical protein QAD02_001407 [Eretmocerus hayati]
MKEEFQFFSTLSLLTIWACIVVYAESGSVFRLKSGHNMPVIGLGTHGINDKLLEDVLEASLEKGLRFIDTGYHYGNEASIGKVLKNWFGKGGKREDIFVSSKLPYYDMQPSEVEQYIKSSLEKLGLQYLDMYLIHAPFSGIRKKDSYALVTDENGNVLHGTNDPVAIWKEMEKQVKAGRTRSIGLSNFNETQISKIISEAEIKPSNLQIEVHLYHQQVPLREFCQKHGILVTAYAPLGSHEARKAFHPEQSEIEFPNPLKHSNISEIAKGNGKSTAQILLRHLVQNGHVVIPGSKKPNHIADNLKILDFELPDEEMEVMNSLDKGDRGKVFDYKFLKGIEKHPQYPWSNRA